MDVKSDGGERSGGFAERSAVCRGDGTAWSCGVGLFLVADRGWCDGVDTYDRTPGCPLRLVVATIGHCSDAVSDGDTGVGEASTRRVLHAAVVGEGDCEGDRYRSGEPAGVGSVLRFWDVLLRSASSIFLKRRSTAECSRTRRFSRCCGDAVTGIDVHPVATHLARAAWVIAARPAIAQSVSTAVTVPIYLGDSLQSEVSESGHVSRRRT